MKKFRRKLRGFLCIKKEPFFLKKNGSFKNYLLNFY